MKSCTLVLTLLLFGLAVPAAAQEAETPRAAVEHGARPGDRLMVTTRDGAVSTGRLTTVNAGDLVLRIDDREYPFAYDDIEAIQKRKNGVLLGTVIGLGAGLAVGLPLKRRYDNEAADGDAILQFCVASGVIVGFGLDALIAGQRTLYRRAGRASHHLGIQPTRSGAAVAWTTRW